MKTVEKDDAQEYDAKHAMIKEIKIRKKHLAKELQSQYSERSEPVRIKLNRRGGGKGPGSVVSGGASLEAVDRNNPDQANSSALGAKKVLFRDEKHGRSIADVFHVQKIVYKRQDATSDN